jgi:NAD-dependent deacetylase sirtuin 5
MWRKYNAMSLATVEAFKLNPSRVWQFYHYRREVARAAQPNAAHAALAKFSIPTVRNKSAPGSTFTLITQNVDGLSGRALDSVASSEIMTQQPSMLEMHGRLFDVTCTSSVCKHTEANFNSPICKALSGTEEFYESGPEDLVPDISLDDLPRCSKCGALARPAVVWFGETPLYLDEIDKIVDKADLCLVVGTSSTVYPAAMYAPTVASNGGKVAVFNLDRSEGDEDADFLFLGPCERTLPVALSVV